MQILTLKSDQQQNMLINHFYTHVGVRLPLAYIKQGESFLFLDKYNKVLGGYTIILRPNFRFFDFLPKKTSSNVTILNPENSQNFFEANAFFVENKRYLRKILIEMFTKFVSLDRKYLLLFYDLNNKSIDNLWTKQLKFIKIYAGTPAKAGSHKNICFGYVPHQNLLDFLQQLKTRNAHIF